MWACTFGAVHHQDPRCRPPTTILRFPGSNCLHSRVVWLQGSVAAGQRGCRAAWRRGSYPSLRLRVKHCLLPSRAPGTLVGLGFACCQGSIIAKYMHNHTVFCTRLRVQLRAKPLWLQGAGGRGLALCQWRPGLACGTPALAHGPASHPVPPWQLQIHLDQEQRSQANTPPLGKARQQREVMKVRTRKRLSETVPAVDWPYAPSRGASCAAVRALKAATSTGKSAGWGSPASGTQCKHAQLEGGEGHCWSNRLQLHPPPPVPPPPPPPPSLPSHWTCS